MRILLTNDDGIFAPGIQALLCGMREIGEVFVAAPAMEQSAMSQAITVHHPIRVDEYPLELAQTSWSIGGTPTDCVKLALEALMKDKQPDVIVSGINAGMNLGNDVLYSGTVSAAREGALHRIPSFAVSYDARSKANYADAAQIAKRLIPIFMKQNLPADSLLNINIPANRSGKELDFVFTRLGRREYANTFEERIDPRGRSYYWMGGQMIASAHNEDTDIFAVDHGKISITPLHFSLTDDALMRRLKGCDLSL